MNALTNVLNKESEGTNCGCQKRRGKYTRTDISNAVPQVYAQQCSVEEDVVQETASGGQ